MKTAAGVLVLNGPRVLAFRRYDREGLALPCGDVETGESPAMAAVREAKEETGLDVELVAERAPYVGFEFEGNALVYTFLATVRGGALLEAAQGEGVPVWASVREVAQGPYWHYNQRALRCFGVRPPLSGKFHSHLTIEAGSQREAERAAHLTGGKLTVIDLSRGERQQTDWMITHHYVTGARGLEDQYDIEALLRARARQLDESGVKVVRVKLEYDLLHDRSDRGQVSAALDNLYTEIHVKCLLDEGQRAELCRVAAKEGWHPSRNPFAVRDGGQLVQFVNRRFYGETRLAEIDAAVDRLLAAILPHAEVLEIKYETAVYDSNDAHDRWWMAG
jgi:ADP-ribose pyrophosphatase YjhB (NUDIX family)